MESGNAPQPFGSVGQKVVLVPSDVSHAEALHVIEGRTKPHSIRDIARTSLKARRGRAAHGLFESDVLNHATAALPRLRLLQNIQLAIHGSDARGRKNLVARKYVEVAIEQLYIHHHVGYGLGAIEKHFRALAMRYLDHLLRRRDGAESIRHLRERNEPRPRTHEFRI